MLVSALSSASKCFGIELMCHPAQYADKLLSRFAHQMQTKGVSHAPIQLIQGDFLECPEVKTALGTAGLVFVNNPKFGPELNNQILIKLCPLLLKGTKLICFESLIGTKGYWNDTMRYKTSLVCRAGCVSWHWNDVTLHILEKL